MKMLYPLELHSQEISYILQIVNFALVCSDSEKALADNLESQFQSVPVSLMQMYNVEPVKEAMESFALVPAREPLLTNPTKVSKVIAELKGSGF